jgi:hypothetical protein
MTTIRSAKAFSSAEPVRGDIRAVAEPTAGAGRDVSEKWDNPLERLELLAGNESAIDSFLDELDVRSPREREMLAEIARKVPLARPDRFLADHRRAVAALESVRRHGFRGSRAAASLGPARAVVRWLVELVARYIVVSYVKSTVTSMRNLYWVREMEAEDRSPERTMLRRARRDAEGLVVIMQGRELGVPSFVFAGVLIPVAVTIARLASGFSFDRWWVAFLVGLVGVAIGVGMSWILLRGTAMASRRIRHGAHDRIAALWRSIGWCGEPPKDQSRSLAIVGITLMVGVWVVLPALVAISLTA